MSIPKRTDVLIIGGGPAGSMAATKLAQQNIGVVLLEKQKFPRHTVGESLIPHFWKFTDEMNISEAIQNEGFIKKAGGATLWDGSMRTVSFADYGHKLPGLHVERDRFDEILLNQAKRTGASVFENVQVVNVNLQSDKNSVTYRHKDSQFDEVIEAKYVIDASGQNAIVAKQKGLREFDENFRFQAFYGYFDRSDYINRAGTISHFESRFEDVPLSFISGTEDWGWVWHLILKEKVSVGALIPKSQMEKFKKDGNSIEDRYLNHIRKTPLTEELLSSANLISNVYSIKDYAYHPKEFVIENCFLAGDAAAFADPINSEGVTMSLYGGFLASYAISNALKNSKRADFYKQIYSDTLLSRSQLFQLLSYPVKKMPAHLIKSCKDILKNQSHDESSLILAHMMLTRRSNDFVELMNKLEIPVKNAWREIPVPVMA